MKDSIGIVGCGAVVNYFYVRQLPRIPGARVRAVADLNPELAAKAAAAFGCEPVAYEEMLTKVGLVIVATPPGSHRSLAKAALEKGCHVWVEKPFVGRRADAVELVELARRAGRQAYVGQFRRFFPAVRLMRELVLSGVFGRVRELQLFEGGRYRWQTNSEYISRDPFGGVLMDTGSHLLDIGLFATGLDRTALTCRVETVKRDKEEPAHEVDARFALEVEHGQVACRMALSRFSALANKARVVCDHGWVECGLMPAATVRIGGPGGATVVKPKEEIPGDQECFRRQCEAILLDQAVDLVGAELFVNQITILEAILNHGPVRH